MAQHNDLGKKGEELARRFLSDAGHSILEVNWRVGKAEIDIISKQRDVLVICEVKTRTSCIFGEPEEFISIRKMRMLVDAAICYAQQILHDGEVRFDVVGVVWPKNGLPQLHYFEDAFFPEIEQ